MGRNNQARRAAKAKHRARQRAQHAHRSQGRQDHWFPWSDPVFTEAERLQLLWSQAAQASLSGAQDDPAMDRLREHDSAATHRVAQRLLLSDIDGIWRSGWQPAEVVRELRRSCSKAAAHLGRALILADHATHRARQWIDPRWQSQITALRPGAVDESGDWLAAWRRFEGLDRTQADLVIASVMGRLGTLPELEPLIPPPGRRPAAVARHAAATADPILQKIRALLAKAESTSFEAEATAFTAKAQELMTRYAIDRALVEGAACTREVTAIRVPIDAPYADAKSLLLQCVAQTGRCRSVFLTSVAMSTLIGEATDVTAAELLFTSLLVQAQQALSHASRGALPGTRVRSQSYRATFFIGFAHQVHERLRAANEAVFADTSADAGRYLPVLASHQAALDDYVEEHYGTLTMSGVRGGYDRAGYVQGRAAGKDAKLTVDQLGTTDPLF